MAYRETGRWEILEVLRRVARGERQRAIQRVTGHSRSSIRRWVRRPASSDGSRAVGRKRLLAPRIEAWLRPEDGGRGLRLAKVHALLEREGFGVPYSSLHYFAVKHCGFQRGVRAEFSNRGPAMDPIASTADSGGSVSPEYRLTRAPLLPGQPPVRPPGRAGGSPAPRR